MKKVLYMTTEGWKNRDCCCAADIDTYIGNTGNLVFEEALYYYASLENEVFFYDWHRYTEERSKYLDEINNTFDMVVFPAANQVRENPVFLDNVCDLLDGLTIPIYIFGLGISIHKIENLSKLERVCDKAIQRLLKIVDGSGGRISFRGYLTEELFHLAGYHEGIATGCPSMYQNGILKIKKNDRLELLGINGYGYELGGRLFTNLRNTIFFDQGEFMFELVDSAYLSNYGMIKKYSLGGANMLLEGKVVMFTKLPVWYQYIRENIDFMVGSRMHGNIITLLAGKPAMLILNRKYDYRVKEIGEFYKIPIIEISKNSLSIDELWDKTDYKEFNDNHEKKFELFRKYLSEIGLCSNLPRTKNAYLEDANKNTNGFYRSEERKTLGKSIDKLVVQRMGRIRDGLSRMKHIHL